MKIFLTGASGFIGKKFAIQAAKKGNYIYAITRKKNARKKQKAQREAKKRALKGFSICLSKTATSKLLKLARKETGGRVESIVLEKLIEEPGKFTKGTKHSFRVSKDAYKALKDIETRYKLDASTIVEKLLKRN